MLFIHENYIFPQSCKTVSAQITPAVSGAHNQRGLLIFPAGEEFCNQPQAIKNKWQAKVWKKSIYAPKALGFFRQGHLTFFVRDIGKQ